MSISLMTDVWKINLHSPKKMVLLSLADNANDEGTDCFPSIATIVEKCSMGERTVFRHLSSLEDDQLIKRHERPGQSTNYVINVEKIRELVAIKLAQKKQKTVDKLVPQSQVIHNESSGPTPDNLAGVPANPHSINTPARLTGVPDWQQPLPDWHTTPAKLAPITTTDPSLNHHNNGDELQSGGGCGDSEIETTKTKTAGLIWPICSTEDRTAISGILATLPSIQHQVILDELEGARQAGTIRKGLVPFAGGLARAMHKGTFTVGYSPSVATKRREHSKQSSTVESLRTFLPEIAADAVAEGQKLMEKIRQESLNRKNNSH